jgi:hypothetical protein
MHCLLTDSLSSFESIKYFSTNIRGCHQHCADTRKSIHSAVSQNKAFTLPYLKQETQEQIVLLILYASKEQPPTLFCNFVKESTWFIIPVSVILKWTFVTRIQKYSLTQHYVPKEWNPQLHFFKNFKMWKRFAPSPKHPDWFYGQLACGFQGPFPSG